jgi:short-subunit dehydrogenase
VIEADLSRVEEAIAATEDAVSIGFDILINNAGIATSGEYDAVPFERWRKTIDVNVIGLMAVTHTALPHLRSRKAAHIINMSSIAGVIGSPGMAAYTASKFAVNGFTRCLEYDLDGTKVGVTSIHPSMVRTRMIEGVSRSKNTPEINVDQVVKAVLFAIRKNRHQVFIPAGLRWGFDIGSRLFPGLTRKMMRDDDLQGWKRADKDIPDA